MAWKFHAPSHDPAKLRAGNGIIAAAKKLPDAGEIAKASAIVRPKRRQARMRTAAISFLMLIAAQATAHATCGTHGGPGYRGPDGKCMGWAELGRVCGCPPSTKCTAEQAHPDAEKAACMGKGIDKMKRKAHEAKPPNEFAGCYRRYWPVEGTGRPRAFRMWSRSEIFRSPTFDSAQPNSKHLLKLSTFDSRRGVACRASAFCDDRKI